MLAPLAAGLPSPILEGLDRVRDQFRGLDGQAADTAREEVPDRDFWQREPTIFDDSIDYIGEGLPTSLVETDSFHISVYSVPEVTKAAPSHTGAPISVVGLVADRVQVAPYDSFSDSITTEYTLEGPDPSVEMRVGLTADNEPVTELRVGQLALAQGLLVASGVAKRPGRPAREATYLYGTSIQTAYGDEPVPRLRRLIRAIVRSEAAVR